MPKWLNYGSGVNFLRGIAFFLPAIYIALGSGSARDKVNRGSKTYLAYNLESNSLERQHLVEGLVPKGWVPSIIVEVANLVVGAIRGLI